MTQVELGGLHACNDGFYDNARHLELGVTILDVVAARDPAEIRVGNPDRAALVLSNQETDRPVKARIGYWRPGTAFRAADCRDDNVEGLSLIPALSRKLGLFDPHQRT